MLDASVTLAWLFRDEPSAHADEILDQVEQGQALVPSVWVFEVANAILHAERRGRIAENESDGLREDLAALAVAVIHVQIDDALGPVLGVARSQRLTVYDASYLELALREGLPLATQDVALRAAAERLGVPLVD